MSLPVFERTQKGAVTVVSGNVPLNRENVPLASQHLLACLADGQPMAVLDLGDVPLIDSSGLEFLLDSQDEFARRGGAVKLARLSPLCRDVLHVTRVERYFEIHANVMDAVGSFLR
jgi:anti-sigma B factor antagonist